jgi:hypothetical protein
MFFVPVLKMDDSGGRADVFPPLLKSTCRMLPAFGTQETDMI